MITFDNVAYRYNQDAPLVINNLSLNIKEGESLAVMGLNGSGKSTFALLTAGLLEPNRGIIRINSKKSHPIGYIFQNPDNQMVAMTVEKEIAFALENRGEPVDSMKSKVSDILNEFNISHLKNRITSELSGGEKQRVALASVMITQPDILVLDEPDSFLDKQGKLVLEKELHRIKNANPEMIQIHITQYVETAAKYERLIIFKDGDVTVDDKPNVIFADDNLCRKGGLVVNQITAPIDDIIPIKDNDDSLENIECNNITFTYSDSDPIIRNLSCNFLSGEITGLVGYSGSGKSTLGAILTTLLPVENGKITYFDNDHKTITVDSLSGIISGVFQQPERQFFLNSCRDELMFGPQNIGIEIDKVSMSNLFELVGLDYKRFADRDPFTLSGGEKRRLAFAVVLAMNPDFLIFDEPTCGLDWQGVELFINLAEYLKKAGKGLIIISHDGNLIFRLCDKVLLLDNNKNYSFSSKNDFFADTKACSVISNPSK
jgi:energy-coupling factor transport system ATP-binding protein